MKKNKNLTRKEFIKLSSLATAGGILLPNLLMSQECELTTADILGPFYDENAPFRIYLSTPDEPGTPITISGRIFGLDCETALPNTLVEVWHANVDGCYSVFQMCDTGNSENDEYHLRGKMLTNEDGYYEFHTIQPGHYQSRPKHFHIKFTAPDGTTLVTQIYFEGDPFLGDDPWANEAGNRIIPLTETTAGLIGEMDVALETETIELLLGDVNFDGQLNVTDIVGIVHIILGLADATENQLYVADVNQDGLVNIVDVITLVNIVLNPTEKNYLQPSKAEFEITDNEITLLTKEPIAGIQLELTGNYDAENFNLPNGWESYYHNNRLVVVNLSGSGIENPSTIFKFSGEISISNIIVCGWNEKLIQAEIGSIISNFQVDMPYPNPFNPAVKIGYSTKVEGEINISVFNIRGKFIETIVNKSLIKGSHVLNWQPKALPTGVYLIKFEAGKEIHYRQVIYLK
jgi:catechol 1,2-dioxygenase